MGMVRAAVVDQRNAATTTRRSDGGQTDEEKVHCGSGCFYLTDKNPADDDAPLFKKWKKVA